jgi:hypothetical protein
MYYVTGGVVYHRPSSSQTLGEIDLFVGRRDTCEAVVVGEAKLGTSLGKAKQQLNRLESFLINYNSAGFSGVYQPSSVH